MAEVKGFFSTGELGRTKEPVGTIAKCGACQLYKRCKSPKMEPSGKGERKILLVAEAPGKDEDDRGKQLVGLTGRYLGEILDKVGVSMRTDCHITNAVICRPPKNIAPTDKQLEYCKPNLVKTIQELKPEIIIPLGGAATKSVVSLVWDKADSSIMKWAGHQIPARGDLNAWICPTYHPSFVMRSKRENRNDISEMFFTQHLEAASKLTRAPYPESGVSSYQSWVEVITDTSKAAKILRTMIKKGGAVGIDIETNRLKPDVQGSEIVTAAVCWNGSKTIAFPMEGKAVDALKELLKSPLKKVAHNIQFEDRWFRKILKLSVKNWHVDSMVNAHVLDNRRGVVGLKFQAFVLFGQEVYDDHIQEYLKSSSADGFNRIREADMHELLLYNGLDALLCFLLARKQVRKFGKDLVL